MKVQDGHMTSVRDHLIVFTVSGTPGKDAIDGMSGGGIYHVANERPYLVGVEFGMDSINKHQQYGRVQCQGLVR
ncbi:TPA: serine protease, partial [Klebsiella pneumoniae]|nr:serine protease [Klebsiella pneumoniae]